MSTKELESRIAVLECQNIDLLKLYSDVSNKLDKIISHMPQESKGRLPEEVIMEKKTQFRNIGPLKRNGRGEVMLDPGQRLETEADGRTFLCFMGRDGEERYLVDGGGKAEAEKKAREEYRQRALERTGQEPAL